LLLDAGADPNLPDSDGVTPLVHAVNRNHVPSVQLLAARGADIEKPGPAGYTPLEIAIGDEKLMYDAFKIGRVDAIVVAPPFSVQLKREGFPLLAHTAEYVTIPFSGLGTTIERIKSNRAQIKRLLKAEIEALRYIQANAAGTTEVIRKRFNMDEKLARESYDVVVNAFSRDGRVPLAGVDILLQIEKDAKQIPPTVTPQMVVEQSLVEEALKELGG
jgi:ABC-type nitrate/sulfonate/bicarbonate transport system substrate-binding protein